MRINFIYLFLIVLGPCDGSAHNNATIQDKEQNEEETRFASPIRSNDNHHELQSSEGKDVIKDSSTRKREAILPIGFQGSLGAGLLLPSKIKAQLDSGINLRLDQGTVPNLKEQISNIPGASNTAKYPIQLYVINSKDVDKKLKDLKVEKIPVAVLNSTLFNHKNCSDNVTNVNNSVKTNNVNSVNSTISKHSNKTSVRSVNKSHNSNNSNEMNVKVKTPSLSNNLSKNLSIEKPTKNVTENSFHLIDHNNTQLLNGNDPNVTNYLLSKHKDNLKNDAQKPVNETCKVINNNNNSESINSEVITEDNIMALIAVLKPMIIDDLKSRIESDLLTNHNKNERTQNTLEISINENNCGLKQTDQLEPAPTMTEVKETVQRDNYETIPFSKQNKYKVTEKFRPVYVNSQSRNPFQIREIEYDPNNYELNWDGNISTKLNNRDYRFKDHNMNTCPYEEPESKSKYTGANSNENNLKHVYNGKRNNIIQEYPNISPVFKYPFKYQNTYSGQHKRTEPQRMNFADNDLRIVYKNRNNDDLIPCRNFKICTTNKPSHVKVNLNYENFAMPKQIQYQCNQRSLIDCNGFYKNQNTPITYPSHVYYPYTYKNDIASSYHR